MSRGTSAGMVRAVAGGVTLAVRAQPGAKKTAIVGVIGEGATAQLKIAVQAPPIEGRANEALIAFLAKTFGLPKRNVELVSGELSRSKVFLLRGASGAAICASRADVVEDASVTGNRAALTKLRPRRK